jgi:hypothetical protein
MHQYGAYLVLMRFIGAKTRRAFALSGGMSLVAQCFKPDFLHGTVAAIRFCVVFSDGIAVQSVTS